MTDRPLTQRMTAAGGFVDLAAYQAAEGYAAARQALTQQTPASIRELVTDSNLRGRGGAGFPTGVKWGFVPQDDADSGHTYLVCNCDEMEPGTFKDREIMERNPFQFLEGVAICAYAAQANVAYIYCRGEFWDLTQELDRKIEELHERGLLGKKLFGSKYSLKMFTHLGAGAYICGEETALLESIEGKKGWPRMKPPFPAIEGLFGCPTIVNNVETLAYVPTILERGADWFANLGSERNGGLRFYCVSGHVKRPGVYELPMGTPLRDIIYDHAGGLPDGKELKAVVPGGSSSPILRHEEIDVKMDYDSLAEIGSMLGSAGVIVMDDATDMVRALYVVTRFYQHESCGQCTPCREGTGWAERILKRIMAGNGRLSDLDNLVRIAGNIMGNTICPLGDAAALPLQSYITKFRSEFEEYIESNKSVIVSTPDATVLAN